MNHTDVVANVKERLLAQGVSLAGSCGAYQITKNVAWELRGEMAGLLFKPDGNNCEFRAVDVIAYPDGSIYDILVRSGSEPDGRTDRPEYYNIPAWQPQAPVDGGRWRAPTDPGGTTPIPVPPDPTPIPPPTGPKKVALRSVQSGKYVSMWDEPHTLIANRDEIGPGEQYFVVILE
jgi:hypothetical protein